MNRYLVLLSQNMDDLPVRLMDSYEAARKFARALDEQPSDDMRSMLSSSGHHSLAAAWQPRRQLSLRLPIWLPRRQPSV